MAKHTTVSCDRCGFSIPKNPLRVATSVYKTHVDRVRVPVRTPEGFDTREKDLCAECLGAFADWFANPPTGAE